MENNSTPPQEPSPTSIYNSQSSNYIAFDSTPRKQNVHQQKQNNKYRPYNNNGNQWNSHRKPNNSYNKGAFQRETLNTEQFTPRQFSSPMNHQQPPFYRNNKRPYMGGRKFYHDNGGDGGNNFRNNNQNHNHKQPQKYNISDFVHPSMTEDPWRDFDLDAIAGLKNDTDVTPIQSHVKKISNSNSDSSGDDDDDIDDGRPRY